MCAKQMPESMDQKTMSTCAEGSDVVNPGMHGADCIILSGETEKGNYFLEVVHMQHMIAHEAEVVIYHLQLL